MADEDVQYVINFDNYDAVLLPGNVADAIGLCRQCAYWAYWKDNGSEDFFQDPG